MCLADGRWREFLMVSVQDESNLRWPTTVYIWCRIETYLLAFLNTVRTERMHEIAALKGQIPATVA